MTHKQFLDGAVGFVDGLVGERRRAGVRIGDGHQAKPSPADYVRPLSEGDLAYIRGGR